MPAHCPPLGKAVLSLGGREALGRLVRPELVRRAPRSHTAPEGFLGGLRRARAEYVAHGNEEERIELICAASRPSRRGRRPMPSFSLTHWTAQPVGRVHRHTPHRGSHHAVST